MNELKNEADLIKEIKSLLAEYHDNFKVKVTCVDVDWRCTMGGVGDGVESIIIQSKSR